MSEPRVISNIKDALSAIEEVNKLATYEVKVPSSESPLVFREINARQQKEILQSIVDSPFYKTHFILAVYNILKENCVEGDFDNLTILDKLIILLKMRIECFSSTFSTDNGIIDLVPLYDQGQSIEVPKSAEITLDEFPIKVTVQLPTIKTEFTLENELHKSINVTEAISPEVLRQALGNAFVGEISKYITIVDINGSTINFSPLKFKDRIQILEQLPNKLVQKVVEYIDNTKKTMDSVITAKVKKDDDTTDVILDIDASFLTIR